MTLIKSISGFRGTIGGKPGDTLNPIDIAKSVSAYASLRERVVGPYRRKIVVGRDARISGEMVSHVVCGTLMGMGFDVLNIGLASTPTTELAVTMERACGGIIITASHNPRQWNALKFLNEHGEFLPPKEAQEVVQLARSCDFSFADVDNLGCYTKNFYFDQRHIDLVKYLELVDVEAIRKANEDGKKHLINVPTNGTTIPHPIVGYYGTAKVVLLPAEEGAGVIAGGAARPVLELAGIKDIRTKSFGTNNKINTVKATIEGLKQLRSAEQVAQMRGKTVEEILG